MVRRPCVYKMLSIAMITEDVTISELADLAGIEYKALCKRLNGCAKISVDEAIAIYKALNCAYPIETLFARSGSS